MRFITSKRVAAARAYYRARKAYACSDFQNALHFQALAAWLHTDAIIYDSKDEMRLEGVLTTIVYHSPARTE